VLLCALKTNAKKLFCNISLAIRELISREKWKMLKLIQMLSELLFKDSPIKSIVVV
ncbi:hypothetical protein L9F63_019818, partial [Diploptera punctata]